MPGDTEATPISSSRFLPRHGARLQPGTPAIDDEPQPRQAPGPDESLADRCLNWQAERALGDWKPLDIADRGDGPLDWGQRTLCFSASCDVGREVARLLDPQGQELPLRLAQVGAVSVEGSFQPGTSRLARRSWARLERVVALAADRFEWDEIEEWSAHLARHGFRLLIVPSEAPASTSSLSLTDQAALDARARTLEEALRLERQAILATPEPADDGASSQHPVLMAGPLSLRRNALTPTRQAVGVCPLGFLLPPLVTPEWQPIAEAPGPRAQPQPGAQALPRQVRSALDDLRPGQRTPAWLCDEAACPLACWFLRLAEAPRSPGSPLANSPLAHSPLAGSPLGGVVRIEVRREMWDAQPAPHAFASQMSRLMIGAAMPGQPMLWPHAGASQQMRALLTPPGVLEAEFARLCGL